MQAVCGGKVVARVMMYGERQLIDRIAAACRRDDDAALLRAIGDDCAVLAPAAGSRLLLSVDTLVEGVHFDLGWHPPRLLGRKAAAVNISDIAAMAGEPRYALLSLSLPAAIPEGEVDELLAGFLEALARWRVALIGGDTVASPAGMSLTVTIIGECRAHDPVYRSGARPGDTVLVGGPLGLAAAGLEICRAGGRDDPAYGELCRAHLDPTPQVELGLVLGASGVVAAMQDISDGLATDLAHICRQSGVGAVVEAGLLPVHPQLAAYAALRGISPLEWMLSGGEDYRLLCTCAAEAVPGLVALAREKCGCELYPVGGIVAGAGVRLENGDGGREIGFSGYDHFRTRPGKG
ncbi:MAG: thiamine-phosphate kinase [Thermodesulfobacteriota bacterium]